jgi:hypothetical protein
MIAPQKQKRVSTQKSKKIAISEPIPIPIPAPPPVVAEKPPSYRQKLIERIGLQAVREKERLSRQATKERKAQAIEVA